MNNMCVHETRHMVRFPNNDPKSVEERRTHAALRITL